jgi:hypothetical protein
MYIFTVNSVIICTNPRAEVPGLCWWLIDAAHAQSGALGVLALGNDEVALRLGYGVEPAIAHVEPGAAEKTQVDDDRLLVAYFMNACRAYLEYCGLFFKILFFNRELYLTRASSSLTMALCS